MKRTTLDLIALQTVDLRIRELTEKYKSVPCEKEELVREFHAAQDELAKATDAVRKLEMKIKGCEADIAAKKSHLQAIRLRSGSIKKVSDYNAAMSDIAETEKEISAIEDLEIETMDALDQSKSALETTQKRYRATGRTVQKEVRELDELQKSIADELQLKSAESKELEKRVAFTSLEVYKRLLSAGKGTPVGTITEAGHCSNCNLQLPPMTLSEAKKGGVVHCDNCSHLLYDPNSAE